MKTILVTLDGSPLSLEALPHALGLSRRYEAQLTLLAVDEDPALYELDAETLNEWKERKLQLDSLARRLQEAGWPAQVLTVPGVASDEILQRAQDPETTLVMSSHGRSGVTRFLLGSVTDRVVRNSRCPALVVRCPRPVTAGQAEAELGSALAGSWPVYRRILVPLDGSSLAEHALEAVLGVAAPDSAVVLLRVSEFPIPIYGGGLPAGWAASVSHEAEADCRKYLADRATALRLRGPGLQVETVVRRGSAALGILEQAQDADLLLMSSCSRTWLDWAVMGSAASRVLHHAPCPILMLKS